MVNMTDIFGNALSIAGSFMDSDLVNRFMMVIFAVILVFGVLNCILGYRLLRFWMMLGRFSGRRSVLRWCCTYNGNTRRNQQC